MNRLIMVTFLIMIFFWGHARIVTGQFSEEGVQKLRAPVPAPDFTLKELEGGNISSKELRGKIVVLNFFTSWCPICREEFRSFDKLREEFKDKEIVFLKVAVKAKERDLMKYKKFSPILTDSDGLVAKAYGIQGHHETFFIDREGKIIGRTFTERDWTSISMRNLILYLLEQRSTNYAE